MQPVGDLQPIARDLARELAAITGHAHALRRHGLHSRAVSLLRAAARHRALPMHARQGMLALSDLFRAYPADPLGMPIRAGGSA